ncbi:signal transduction histidine kinase/ligand-binding sensor domain-containing protein [Silvibacterium bohemicum]|uniref:Signal transduction histidine kinase/ligand-binding sensor domain-containing protein n=1 Tax=Silvibacterium bohemicum TaxID=1577686 RepID=A0A841K5K4_9BACT|nr:sensor histidine kinase [Silvibacterium bohemicum]MBB6146421.1 signal transduction histidine kinase/ligand-binding sensor domain-containing protein [Silvibacterium bohemicum]
MTAFRRLAILVVFFLSGMHSILALDPARQISQYRHSAWRAGDGDFNGSPAVLAQTLDGYLWIGTGTGLIGFDGVRFVPWVPPAGQQLLDPRIFSLLGARDGSLWIGTGFSISHWKNGRLTNYPELSGRIEAMAEDGEGSIWLARTHMPDKMGPVCRIKNEQLRCFAGDQKIPFPNALQLANGGHDELWIGGYSELCLWKPGSGRVYFPNVTGRPEGFPLFKALAAAPDGSAWAAIDVSGKFLQLQHFEGSDWKPIDYPGIGVENSDVTAVFIDRENSPWIGTAHHGIFRVRGDVIDHFDRTDGLSSDDVASFFQDKEGTVWVATSAGIDNFRDTLVTTYSMREGLSADSAMAVLGAHDGTLWIINNYESLESLRGNQVSALRSTHGLPGRHVSTFYEDRSGQLWVGIDNNLWVYQQGVFRVISHTDGSPLGIIFSIAEDGLGNMWVRAGPNLDRIRDFKVQEEYSSQQVSTSYILTATADGSAVLGLVNGDLVFYKDGKTQTIPSHEAGHNRQIRDLLVDSDGSVWGTNVDELIRWKDGVRTNLGVRNGLPCDGIFALVEDKQGSIWLYTKCGLVSINKSQLDLWRAHPDTLVKNTLLDVFDGVQPGLTDLKPQATMTPDGRLWFVNKRLLQMVDLSHVRRNEILPPVHIEEVVADRENYSAIENLRLPALTRDLRIDYTALSFVDPKKVRFRYRLEGHDSRWQEAGIRRQAFYMNLSPGNYRFHVIACNNDGLWNETGATLDFSVAPAWYQTKLFLVLSAATVFLLGWLIYQMRIRKIAAIMSARFDERLAERTRLARELHDTLLQTIQGSKMVADDALDESVDLAAMRRAMERVSGWLGKAMEEGRTALRSLRASTLEANDLASSLRDATKTCLIHGSMEVEFSVNGTSRPMHPIVRDEIYRIGYEAIRNASIHSKGSRLLVELVYGQDLLLRVKDNGNGMEPAIAEAGKKGHFGLQGMRERAARIGAKLSIVTFTASGTEVSLAVPGRSVFRGGGSSLRDIFRRIRAHSTREAKEVGVDELR